MPNNENMTCDKMIDKYKKRKKCIVYMSNIE